MTTFLVGERMVDRLIHQPAIALTSPLTIDKPVSANRVMHAANNASHMCLESVRQCVWTGGYPVDSYSKDGDPWLTIRDSSGSSPSTPGEWSEIPWDPRNSQVFGPIYAIADTRTDSTLDPQRTWRQFNLEIELDVDPANGSSDVYFALTTHGRGLLITGQDYLAFDHQAVGGTGIQVLEATLHSNRPAGAAPTTRVRSRPAMYGASGDLGPGDTLVDPIYLHFGWKLDGGGNNRVVSFTATETREP